MVRAGTYGEDSDHLLTCGALTRFFFDSRPYNAYRIGRLLTLPSRLGARYLWTDLLAILHKLKRPVSDVSCPIFCQSPRISCVTGTVDGV